MHGLPSTAHLAAGAAILAAVVAAPAAGAAQSKPRCVGAAAMDALRPCLDRTRSVEPAPGAVARVPFPYCQPVRDQRDPEVCTFGTRAARARAHVALIGDSHALHWRAALDPVARVKRWHGHSITAPACFYSEAVFVLPGGLREPCVPWFESVRSWLASNPDVSTIFVSQNAPTPVEVGPGETVPGVKSAGFQRAWRALPANVRNVVVIRDTPRISADTFGCIRRVMRADTQRAKLACSLPRSRALPDDPALAAVAALRSRRYRAIDMTDFFCGSRRCYPVIGGILVNRDVDHINPIYARTLGPYLLRAIRRLPARW